MDPSGIIFVVLAVAWAVYLVPKALQHHDEAARSRSVDRFSTAMRVLARREPVDRRNARLVLTPARPADQMVLPSRPQPSVAARRAAARAAARRRRRVLSVLLVLDVAVGVTAAFAVIPWWSLAVPVTLTVAFLVLARAQVRRQDEKLWSPSAVAARVRDDAGAPPPVGGEVAGDVVPRRAVRVEAPYGTVSAQTAAGGEFADDEDTVQIAYSELEAVAVPVETVDGESLWDPLPVTLPTYVHKERAARTVRTIDLSAPGSWSSGRDEADTALVEQAVAADEGEAEEAQTQPRKAVGS